MRVDFKNYYDVLGVAKNASDAEIKKAFRKLARKYHPDVAKDKASAEIRFKEINEANEVLSDPDKRRKFDELGANWNQPDRQTAQHDEEVAFTANELKRQKDYNDKLMAFDDAGKLLKPGTVTILQNGVLIQDNVEIKGPTGPPGKPKYEAHALKQPLALQDHHNPIRFRNIWIREL